MGHRGKRLRPLRSPAFQLTFSPNPKIFTDLAIDQQLISSALRSAGDAYAIRHMKGILASLLIVAACCSFSFPQSLDQVKVRVLDYRTGKPAKQWEVRLLTGNRSLVAVTAKDGAALFPTTGPLPDTLSVDPEAGSWSQWSCADRWIFRTSDVLQHGVVAGFLQHPLCRQHMTSTATTVAGEIVIYARHLNPWLTFRRILWETFHG